MIRPFKGRREPSLGDLVDNQGELPRIEDVFVGPWPPAHWQVVSAPGSSGFGEWFQDEGVRVISAEKVAMAWCNLACGRNGLHPVPLIVVG